MTLSNRKTPAPKGGNRDADNLKSQPPPSTKISPSTSYLYAVAAGLLSSSCCVVQLVLNAFSVGCAGFSVLTPYRPLLLSLSLGLVLYTVLKHRLSARTLVTVSITLGLAITPELVAVVNQGAGPHAISTTGLHLPLANPLVFRMSEYAGLNARPPVNHDVVSSSSATNSEAMSTAEVAGTVKGSALFGSSSLVKYEIKIEGMACEACASRLRQHFLRQPGIAHANVHFKEGKLFLWTAGQGGLVLSESTVQEMVHEVDSKYRAELIDVFSEPTPEM